MKKRLTFIWNTKFQQLTMESLFGRFPYLVEDIFGLLNGKTLSCCSQVNTIWSKKLEEYRLYLVKKIKKQLKNQNIVGHFDMVEAQTSPEIQYKISYFSIFLNRILESPKALEKNNTLEQLSLQFLIQLQRFICDSKLRHCKVDIKIKFILKMLTSCVLRTNKELINEGLVYDIIANWDTIGRDKTEAKHYKEFRTSLTKLQNKYVKCDKVYCYSCCQDLATSFFRCCYIYAMIVMICIMLYYL